MSRLLILVIKVDMQEFVKLCLLDKVLGDAVLKIFRAVISESSTKVKCKNMFLSRHLELHLWKMVFWNVLCADQASQGYILGQDEWYFISNSFLPFSSPSNTYLVDNLYVWINNFFAGRRWVKYNTFNVSTFKMSNFLLFHITAFWIKFQL